MDRPLDVLVIAPTEDELKVCEKVLYAKPSSSRTSKYKYHSFEDFETIPIGRGHFSASIKMGTIGDLMVGLFSIGGSGNLNAAIKCYELLDVYRPKAVFLTGIAAGKSPETDSRGKPIDSKVRVGDVICNDFLIYSSYGKTSSDGKFEYRNLRHDVVPHLFVSDIIRKLIMADSTDENKNRDWQSLAKDAFDKFATLPAWTKTLPEWKNVKSRWSPEHFFDSSDHPADTRDRSVPSRSHLVDVASGEVVLASTEFQDQLRETVRTVRGNQITIQAFEMEAYGIARICQEKGIPFLTVRGISDSGD